MRDMNGYEPVETASTFELLRELRKRKVLQSVCASRTIPGDVTAQASERGFDFVRKETTVLASQVGRMLLDEGIFMQYYNTSPSDPQHRLLRVAGEVVTEHANVGF